MDEKFISVTKFKESLAKLTVEGGTEATRTTIARTLGEVVPRLLDDEPSADVQPINSLVKVEERVPDVSGNYLCYLTIGEFDVLYFDREIEDAEYNNDYPFGVWNTYPSEDGGECREWIEVLEVTHWQSLPEPPKDGDME